MNIELNEQEAEAITCLERLGYIAEGPHTLSQILAAYEMVRDMRDIKENGIGAKFLEACKSELELSRSSGFYEALVQLRRGQVAYAHSQGKPARIVCF